MRFKSNRWWILVLTLSLACTPAAFLPKSAFAVNELDGDPTAGNPFPPPAGDPDIPVSRAKRSVREGATRPAAGVSTRVGGDGTAVDGVMTWRIRVALQSLRYWSFFRF